MEQRVNQLMPLSQYAGAKGPVSVRVAWTPLGDSTYRAESFGKAGDLWRPMFAVDYRRIKRAS